MNLTGPEGRALALIDEALAGNDDGKRVHEVLALFEDAERDQTARDESMRGLRRVLFDDDRPEAVKLAQIGRRALSRTVCRVTSLEDAIRAQQLGDAPIAQLLVALADGDAANSTGMVIASVESDRSPPPELELLSSCIVRLGPPAASAPGSLPEAVAA